MSFKTVKDENREIIFKVSLQVMIYMLVSFAV